MSENLESVSFKDLKMVCKQLSKSKLIEEDLKVVGIKKDDLVQNFLEAVESIPEAKEESIPDEVADMYNNIVELLEGSGEVDEPEETEEVIGEDTSPHEPEEEPFEEEPELEEEDPEPEPEPEPEKKSKGKKAPGKTAKKSPAKKTEKKTEKTKGKKAETGKGKTAKKSSTVKKPPKKERDALGATIGSGTNKINEILLKKGGTPKQIGDQVGTPASRVKNHISALKASGVTFSTKEVDFDGKVTTSYKVKEIPDNFQKNG